MQSYSYETADRATFEDSAAKFSISRSRTDCTEVSDETTSGISFKTEPFGPPSSPESTSDSKITRNLDDCSGCGRQIQVSVCKRQFLNFYLNIKGKPLIETPKAQRVHKKFEGFLFNHAHKKSSITSIAQL